MPSLFIWLFLSLLTSFTAARPEIAAGLHRRNDSSLFSKISTKVLSPNGTDITSSFQTRVYYRSKILNPHPTFNQSNDSAPTGFVDLNPRGTMTYTYLGRPIGGDGICRSRTAHFQHSACKRSLGIMSSVQEFIVFCQETEEVYAAQNPRFTPRPSTANRGGYAETSYSQHIPPVLAEDGECYPDEICIDGIFKDRGYPSLASCVTEEDFVDDEDITEDLGGLNARVTVTALDAREPVRMRNLEIKAARGRGSSSRAGSSSRQHCGQCSDLSAGPLAADVDSLKVEASLMTAGAMAGVIFIALASG